MKTTQETSLRVMASARAAAGPGVSGAVFADQALAWRALVLAEKRRRLTRELILLGAASAAGLGCIDVVCALRGRISKVYLVDAALEALLVAGWIKALRADV
jgi:hypothetical protein